MPGINEKIVGIIVGFFGKLQKRFSSNSSKINLCERAPVGPIKNLLEVTTEQIGERTSKPEILG